MTSRPRLAGAVAGVVLAVAVAAGCTKELPPTRVPVATLDGWTRTALAPPTIEPSGAVNALVGTRDGWVAGGWGTRAAGSVAQPMTWWSADGRYWDATVLPGAGEASGVVDSLLVGVTEPLVATGTIGRGRDRRPVSWTSRDGRSWSGPNNVEPTPTSSAAPAAPTGSPTALPGALVATARDGSRSLAVAPTGERVLRANGSGDAPWEDVAAEGLPRPRRAAGAITQLAATDKLAVAAGVETPRVAGASEARLWSSKDGLLWNEAVLSAGVRSIDALVVRPDGMFVARATASLPDGSTIPVGFTSRDGINWASVPDPGPLAPACDPSTLAGAPSSMGVAACTVAPDGSAVVAGEGVTQGSGSSTLVPVAEEREHPEGPWQPIPAATALLGDGGDASLRAATTFGNRTILGGRADDAPVILLGPPG